MKRQWKMGSEQVINPDWSESKKEYAAEGRSYCDQCGNSDADMDIDDDICYDCLHPEELKAMNKLFMEEYRYVFGDAWEN